MPNKEQQYMTLMQENRARIFRITSYYCDNAQDVRDLSQEIAYQVWKSFDSFRAESERSTWLHRIALNTSIQFLKRAKRRKVESFDDVVLPNFYTENPIESEDQEIQRLMRAIQHLNQLDKAIILLYLEEHSHAEIGDIVNLSVSNVGTRIQRIKTKLKKLLSQ